MVTAFEIAVIAAVIRIGRREFREAQRADQRDHSTQNPRQDHDPDTRQLPSNDSGKLEDSSSDDRTNDNADAIKEG